MWDRPTAGAREYLHQVAQAGAEILYLTGREQDSMARGTWSGLRHWGFPTGPDVGLAMKPVRGMNDGEFKRDTLKELARTKSIRAIFDNEPANFPHFQAAGSAAMLVFLHSQCSNRQAEPGRGLYRIFDFRMQDPQKIDG